MKQWIISVLSGMITLIAGSLYAQSYTSVEVDNIKGEPGDTVRAAIKVITTAKIAGIQVDITVTDTTVAKLVGFDSDSTVAGDVKASGGIEVTGVSSYAVAAASGVDVTREALLKMGFLILKKGTTTVKLDVVLTVEVNGNINEESHTLHTQVLGNTRPDFTEALADTTIGRNDTLNYRYVATDADGDAVTLFAVELPAGATFDAATGALLWVASVAPGSYTVSIGATDGIDTTTTRANVSVGNSAPVFTNAPADTVSVYQGATLQHDFDVTDVDGDSLWFFVENPPLDPGFSFDAATGEVVYEVPMDAEPGLYSITVGVTDGLDSTLAVLTGRVLSPAAIATVRGTADGEFLTTEGVVTRAMGRFAYIQEGDVAITLFQGSGAFRDAIEGGMIKKGDRLRVYGEVASFHELKEIYPSKYLVVSRNNPLPEAQQVTVAELAANGENYEAELITLYGFELDTKGDTVFSASRNYPIKDASVEDFGLVDLRIPSASDTEWEGQSIPQSPLAFTGVLVQYDAKYQLLAVELGDILSVVANEKTELPKEFAISGLYPNPFAGVLKLRMDMPASMEVKVVLYDVLGREIRVFEEGILPAGAGRELVIKGSDLPAGVYILRVQARGVTGQIYEKVEPVVHVK